MKTHKFIVKISG